MRLFLLWSMVLLWRQKALVVRSWAAGERVCCYLLYHWTFHSKEYSLKPDVAVVAAGDVAVAEEVCSYNAVVAADAAAAIAVVAVAAYAVGTEEVLAVAVAAAAAAAVYADAQLSEQRRVTAGCG